MAVSKTRTVIVLALLLVTYILLQDVTRVVGTPIKQPLANFPKKIDAWQVNSSRESSEEVIRMLGVDDYVEHDYVKANSVGVNFYAAFYEAVGGGSGYHSPKNCIPGGGWGIESLRTVEIQPRTTGEPVKIAAMTIRNGSEYQVVYYWFQNRGRIIHSEYMEKFFLVFDAILKKRRDGTFVRLIAPAPGGSLELAEKALKEFAEIAVSELDNFLPGSIN